MQDLVEATFSRAVAVLKENTTEFGLQASHTYYRQVWARDSFISFLGANQLQDRELLECCRTTLLTLSKTRSPLGQIADLYNPDTRSPEFGFSGATDSSSWFIIGLMNLYHATESKELLRDPLDAAVEAFRWLRFQDANNTWLIDSPQGADWMDAAIRRTGKTLYNNILFLAATRCINKLSEISGRPIDSSYRLDYGLLKSRFNEIFLPQRGNYERVERYWPYLAHRIRDDPPAENLAHYVHFVSFSRFDLHFDTLSNLLCVLTDVAGPAVSKLILAQIRSRKLMSPYPVRVLDPPYKPGEDGFDVEFNRKVPIQHRSDPYNYHNGGVWPFVGGFHVMALQRRKDQSAGDELLKLARANNIMRRGEKVGFNEWLNGRNAKPLGQHGQSWNAGTFVGAYLALKGHDTFDFLK
jgi:glycogen debranching enzyme